MKDKLNSRTRILTRWLVWLLAIALLWLAFRNVPLREVMSVLRRLELGQLAILTLVNLLVVLCLSGRWWWILRTMGVEVSYLGLSVYRLAAFSVSYFTPGPQFGGEPLQVYLLERRHAISPSTAVASVTLDKAIELIGNFTFLVFGLLVGLRLQFLPGSSGLPLLYLALALLLTPLVILAIAWSGRQPLTMIFRRIPQPIVKSWPWVSRLSEAIQRMEHQISAFCCDRPQGLIGALGFNLATWIILIGEYGLMSRFLGMQLGLWETIAVLTAARLAFLTPLPGGLGALEASQALALSALGFSSSEGLSLGLLIRGRDIAFGALGALFAMTLTRRASPGRAEKKGANPEK